MRGGKKEIKGGRGRKREEGEEEGGEEGRNRDTGQEQLISLRCHLPGSLTCSLNSIFSEVTVQLTEAVNAVRVSGSTVNTISLSIGIGSSGT